MGLKLPILKRTVSSEAGDVPKGRSYGLTIGRNRIPYTAPSSQKVNGIVKKIREMLKLSHPGFRFSSLQVNVNSRSMWHVDAGNHGQSVALSLGPFIGGNLCVYGGPQEGFYVVPQHAWYSFDGRYPHFVMPYAGVRVSLIAYTHSSVYSAGSRSFLDLLTRQGFPLPDEAGKGGIMCRDLVDSTLSVDAATSAYEESCEIVMCEATKVTIGEARMTRQTADARLSLPGVVQWFMVCVWCGDTFKRLRS